ncbi:MAG: hypothetical protein GX628_11080 [Clostridiales bacterium]|nr:hypothetical protein [Clostridiales bacterium]
MDYSYISGNLRVKIALSDSGAALASIYDGETPLYNGSGELFKLTLLDLASREKSALSSLSGWEGTSADTGGISLWRSGLRVRISPAPVLKDGFEWTVSFENNMSGFSVYSFEYPRLWFAANGEMSVFFPARSGLIIKGFDTKSEMRRGGDYPSSLAIMQYMALCLDSGRGLYYGMHDIAGGQKRLALHKAEGESDACMYAEYICRDACSPRNSQTLNGPLVWRLFDGSWYDATMIYRDFALKEARWIPEVDQNGRISAPKWLKRVPHWWLFSVGEDENANMAQLLEAEADLSLDVSSALHVYNWHRVPFDNDYPHYIPEKPFFASMVARLHDEGFRVMPYINGRLWDTRDRGAEDYLFTDIALAGATKDEKGEVFTETYRSKESDGSTVRLAVMCPSSEVWGAKVTEVLSEILYRLNTDAVYVDQIASAAPKPCCDPSHPHPGGGGGWWPEAYDRLLARTARTLPPDKAISTESTAEPYMRHIAAFLSWDCVEMRQVPAWAAVYAGYAVTLGRAYYGANDDVVYALTAEGLLFGEQLGWITPARYLELADRGFYRAIVLARANNLEFFTAGRLLRPPAVRSDVPDIRGETMCVKEYIIPAVQAGLFGRNSDGKKLLIVCNCTNTEAKVELSSPDLPGGGKTLTMAGHSIYTEIL